MGIFSGQQEIPEKQMTKKENRKACWKSRDNLFACLDDHKIYDAIGNEAEARKQCGEQYKSLDETCIKVWISHFLSNRKIEHDQQERIKQLEARGAVKINIGR